jgi:hypothetical protein
MKLLVQLPNSDFPSITVTEIDPSTLPPTDTEIVSTVFDLSFSDSIVSDFSVKLCFSANTTKNVCLGYLDESVSPFEWKCENECLVKNRNGQLCGDTSHFTNFALLFTGSIGDGNGGDCQSNSVYITGSFNGDLTLCLIFAGVCVSCGLFVYIVQLYLCAKETCARCRRRTCGNDV